MELIYLFVWVPFESTELNASTKEDDSCLISFSEDIIDIAFPF